MEHGTTLLFGLAGVAVREVNLYADGTRVVDVVTDDETAAACPTCGVFSSARKGVVVTRPKDLPYGRVAAAGALAQEQVAVPGASLPAAVVHRIDRGSPGGGAYDRPAAAGGRRRGGRQPVCPRGGGQPWAVLADRAARGRGPRQASPHTVAAYRDAWRLLLVDPELDPVVEALLEGQLDAQADGEPARFCAPGSPPPSAWGRHR